VAAAGWEARLVVISAGSREAVFGVAQRRRGRRRGELQISRSGQCSSSEQDRTKMAVFANEDADRVAFNRCWMQVEVEHGRQAKLPR
jgi:hypothetical protein